MYKNVIQHITDKIELTYKKGDFGSYTSGKAIYGDYEVISGINGQVDAIICSPPFADSIRLYEQLDASLALRLGSEDYKTVDDKFLDLKQKKISPYTNHSLKCATGF